MRLGTRLFQQYSHRIVLFTRTNCSLCEHAKAVLSKVNAERSFNYVEVDVMQPAHSKWKDSYEFDTPVVCSKSNMFSIPAPSMSDGRETGTY